MDQKDYKKLQRRYYRSNHRCCSWAILAMLSDTMILEAFEHSHEYAGLIAVTGFLAAFILTKISG